MIQAALLRSALGGTRFCDVDVVDEVESTQKVLLAEGGRDGRVLVAEHQTSGRGRIGRTWESPAGRSLLVSVLLRGVPVERTPMVSLAAGVAVLKGIDGVAGSPVPGARLKWPNDVLIDGRKVAGMLGELSSSQEFCVLGMGVNVLQSADELPPGVEATSLRLALGHEVDRGSLLVAVLRSLDPLVAALGATNGPPWWMDEYRTRCATIGSRVRVTLGGREIEGEATQVRDDGVLVVDGEPVLAGDVVHVRRVPK